MNTLTDVLKYGQSIWLDLLDRKIMDSGELKKLIDEDGIRGLTSNPAIFEKAISNSSAYDEEIALLSTKRTAMMKSFFLLLSKILNVPPIFLNRFMMKPREKMVL